MAIIPYNRKFKDRARGLRQWGTLGEVLLWNEIKESKLGVKFTRQKPIDNYIVDFFCKQLMLGIEIDGSSHKSKKEDDEYRQERLQIMGISFLRFSESEVRDAIDYVVDKIRKKVKSLGVSPRGEQTKSRGV